MAKQYLTIHGHFYQPPRENPWTEAIEIQETAHPYHDWNERITDECYGPNAAARRVDDAGRLVEAQNNYEALSFNVGPTLLAWMQGHAPDVYEAILDADRRSAKARGGHGNALAQVYNHIIMPLASPHDRVTQVVWGIADFEHRFGRRPEGLWLAECAADLPTLETLADHGIRFTILAPEQADAVRPLAGGGAFTSVRGAKIDPSRPYLVRLSGGREIVAFFFDGPISRSIAFGDALQNGARFAERLREGFAPNRRGDQLVHVAVDGETFGHHNRFGEMSLADGLRRLSAAGDITLTNYACYLDSHPPEWEARILEPSSWSCSHGVERWRSDCGCHTGGKPGWNQRWREPLRAALDWLKAELDRVFTESDLFRDPPAARNAYVQVLLDPARRAAFLSDALRRPVTPESEVRAWQALEMQRHGLFMATSCGFFFADLAGIETQQVLRHACRAIQLAAELGRDLEEAFSERLRPARSNDPDYGDGRTLYRTRVAPELVTLRRVVAHRVICATVLNGQGLSGDVHHYRVDVQDTLKEQAGERSLSTGRARVRCGRTGQQGEFSFAMLQFQGPDLHCAVRPFESAATHGRLRGPLVEAFLRGSTAQLVRLVDELFGVDDFTLRDLLIEDRRAVLDALSQSVARGFEQVYDKLFEEHRRLMAFAVDIGVPPAEGFRVAALFVFMRDLHRALASPVDSLGFDELRRLAAFSRHWRLKPDEELLVQRLKAKLDGLADRLAADPVSESHAQRLEALLDVVTDFDIGLRLNYWRVHRLLGRLLISLRTNEPPALNLPPDAQARLRGLAKRLHFRLEPLP